MKTQDDSDSCQTIEGSEDTSDDQDLPRGSHLALPRGANLGRYVIIEPIGSGGMGTVYRAYDPQLNRGVALKILSVKHADLQVAERAKARLIREAQALAQLSHPNVVSVHDAGTFEDDVFIAMELVEGKTLDEWMRHEKRSIKEILEVIVAAGKGLSAAHKAGLIHRDFKPGNVIVGDDERVRVLDFGLARAADHQDSTGENPEEFETTFDSADELSQESKDSFDGKVSSSDSSPNWLQSPLTNDGGILGTPLYMAPEQHLGLKTDERTDQFGFCVVLYECLYKKKPFVAKSMEKLRRKVVQQQLRVPRTGTDIPSWLWPIVRKGLSVKPEDRYPTIDSLLNEIDKDPEEERRQRRLAQRRRLFVALLLVALIGLPAGLWYGLRYRTFQLCKAAEGEFADVWDDATKLRVETSFLETEKSYAQGAWERVRRTFGKYLAEWTIMRSDVCEARLIRGTQSEELFDLRMGCLKKRVRDLKALVEIFARADAGVVQKAIQASTSLTPIDICADEGALRAPYPPPSSQESKTRVEAIRDRLTKVQALYWTGKFAEGAELAKKLEKESNAVGYRPVQAEALYHLGWVLCAVDKKKESERILSAAALVAGETKDTQLMSKAMVELVFNVGIAQSRYKEGLMLSRAAEFVVGLVGDSDVFRATLFHYLGSMLHNMGEPHKALQHYQKSLAIKKKKLGPEHRAIARTLSSMGSIFLDLEEDDKALEHYNKALVLYEKLLGEEHPLLSWPQSGIAGVFRRKGEYDKALEYYNRALSIRKKTLGPEHSEVAWSLRLLGDTYMSQGRYDESLESYKKALAIWEKTLGPQDPTMGLAFISLGELFRDQGKHEQALEYFGSALAILENTLEQEHPQILGALNSIGRVYLERGKPDQALGYMERVVNTCERKRCNPVQYAQGLFDLARVLFVMGGDKERALELASKAKAVLEKSPKAFKKVIEEMDDWLKARM